MKDKDTRPLKLIFDSNVYSLKAVKNAVYDFSEKAALKISSEDANKIIVNMHIKENSYSDTDIICMEFNNTVLEHQIRIEVNEDFGKIRELIVAQAFAPCDNLEEIIEAYKP